MKFTEIFIPLVLLLLLFVWITKKQTEVVMKTSKVDGRQYLVQNKPDAQQAADRLAQIRARLIKLVEYINRTDGDSERVKRCVKRFNPDVLSEGTEDARYTTYTLNKGEKVVFCLRTRDKQDHVHDLNLLMFVAIHELGHIMTKSEGHTPEFNENFKYLLDKSIKAGVYTPENYRAAPTNYCGIKVTDSPLEESYF